MNLTQIIIETGKRVRLGKTRSEQLTNAQIQQVLETAIGIMKEALIAEERIEIQDFAVLEVQRISVRNPNTLTTFAGECRQIPVQRLVFNLRVSKKLRQQLKQR